MVYFVTDFPVAELEDSAVGGACLEFQNFWNGRLEAVASFWYWKDVMH